MKIAWLSSWPPRPCGIATYSEELITALRNAQNDIHVICHPDGGRPGEKNVYPVINTDLPGWDETVYDTIQTINPDIVHIQHEFGLYQTSADHASGLFRFLFRLQVQGKYPAVITYHSVYSRLSPMIRLYMDVTQRLVQAGIVHAEYQWMSLHANIGRLLDNAYVIPHGAAAGVSISNMHAKKKLGLDDKLVLGMIGWFTETKGFDQVLEIWDDLAAELDENTWLVLAGDARLGDPNQIGYKKKLLDLVAKCVHKDRIKVLQGSFTPEEYNRIMAAFDLMVMPYTFASQSGNLAHSFALGVPAVVSGLEGLKAEAEASGAAVPVSPGDREELQRAILMIMGNPALRKKYAQRARKYVTKKISWSITAKKHMQVYKKAAKSMRRGASDLIAEAII
ncbi:MAG: glycosyltransferase [Desulfobacterales bacterium]|jgi:glycosyltransferase involved in cell wall biosynthesis